MCTQWTTGKGWVLLKNNESIGNGKAKAKLLTKVKSKKRQQNEILPFCANLVYSAQCVYYCAFHLAEKKLFKSISKIRLSR